MTLCAFCDGSHASRKCERYATAKARRNRANGLLLCDRCLVPGHTAESCTHREPCYYCYGNHHQALCQNEFRSKDSKYALISEVFEKLRKCIGSHFELLPFPFCEHPCEQLLLLDCFAIMNRIKPKRIRQNGPPQVTPMSF